MDRMIKRLERESIRARKCRETHRVETGMKCFLFVMSLLLILASGIFNCAKAEYTPNLSVDGQILVNGVWIEIN